MRVVIQRVQKASVTVEKKVISEMDYGLLILLGITMEDTEEDAKWLCNKIVQMRIFPDEDLKMNKNILDVKGQALVVSQFTLHASTKKGNRPSFIKAAPAEKAENLYKYFKQELSFHLKSKVLSGKFGAMMDVNLINNGPVTILMDSKNKE